VQSPQIVARQRLNERLSDWRRRRLGATLPRIVNDLKPYRARLKTDQGRT
jgi:hypothetical protein